MFNLTGIYSGLDVTAMVDALIQAERAPVESRFNRKESAYNVELSAIGQLQAALDSFQVEVNNLNSKDTFQTRAVAINNEQALSVSASSNAAEGSYQFFIDKLATAHQTVSAPMVDASSIGTGTVSFTVDNASFSVNLESGADSLADLQNAINSAADNVGIQANIINDGDEQRLMLTSTETGVANTITADFSQLTNGSASLNNFTDIQQAEDASIRFGSGTSAINISSSNNQLNDVIDGVSLTLKAASTDPVLIDVTLDKESVKTSVQSLVEAWNSLQGTFNRLTDYNGETAGPLNGDSQTRTIENQLRRNIGSLLGEDGDTFRTLGSIGLTLTVDGSLEFNETTLDEVLNDSFGDVANILSGDNGLMNRMDSVLGAYLESDGPFEVRENRISDELKTIEEGRVGLEERLDSIRSYYEKQFLAMETVLSSFSGTSQWLTNNLTSNNNQ